MDALSMTKQQEAAQNARMECSSSQMALWKNVKVKSHLLIRQSNITTWMQVIMNNLVTWVFVRVDAKDQLLALQEHFTDIHQFLLIIMMRNQEQLITIIKIKKSCNAITTVQTVGDLTLTNALLVEEANY